MNLPIRNVNLRRDDCWSRCDLGFARANLDVCWKRKPRYVRAWGQAYSKLGTVLLLAIIDRESLPEFGRRHSHHVIQIGVIRRLSLKNLDTDRAFFDLICRTVDGLLHNKAEKRNRPLTRSKRVVANQQIKLFTDLSRGYLDFWAIIYFSLNHGNSSDSDSSTRAKGGTD